MSATSCGKYKRRVVVTGLGVVSPIGIGIDTAWANAVKGVSGAAEITLLDHEKFPVHFAHEVKDFNPADWVDGHEIKRTDRFVHLALASGRLAVTDAKLDCSKINPERFGVVYGSGIGGIRSIEDQYGRYLSKGPARISPFTIPYLMTNSACGMLAIEHKAQGPNYSPVSACATGSHALALSLRHIQWGEADIMLTGGSEAGISILGVGGFANMKALSTRNDSPLTASRPFDADRDGFVIGEGAGCIVLEELEHAKARGAHIYAEFLGQGMTDDAFHITAPAEGGLGSARAMTLAVQDAGLDINAIDHINAHGTSTPFNDKAETQAIKKTFGEHAYKLTVCSTKGQTGHTLGAAGAIEFAFAVKAVQENIIPPTINFTTRDPELDLDYSFNSATQRQVNYALSNSLGFGGHNCVVCVGKYTDSSLKPGN